jgi:methylmalonyl-CoA/ethylmalonyl-CoA epimerase
MKITTEESSQAGSAAKIVYELNDCILGLDHVAIAVEDLNTAIEWYRRALGFTLLETRTTRGERTGMRSAVLVAGAAVIVLVQGTEPESQVSRFVARFGAGVQHIAFRVGDLCRVMHRVCEGGAGADVPIIEEEGIRQVFLRRDPGSGVRVELIERRGGDFSDRSVERLFRAFETYNLY